MNIAKLDPQRKAALLNAALKEFTAKGYAEASTNIIAKEAGLSKALMFHYVGSKQDLFTFTCNYFDELLEKEYYAKINFQEKELFSRLRQAYLLQIQLLKQYPALLDYDKLVSLPDSNSETAAAKKQQNAAVCDQLFADIDQEKFRAGLTIETCLQIIFWANAGFTKQLAAALHTQSQTADQITTTLDSYLKELRRIFYDSSHIG